MAKKEDLRVVKSKRALRVAFFTLLRTKKYSEITVNELCDCAGVRRATFYKHYKDKNDFTEYLITTITENVEESVSTNLKVESGEDSSYLYAKYLTDMLYGHGEFITQVVSDHSNSVLVSLLIEQCYVSVMNKLTEYCKTIDRPLNISCETLAGMLSGGITVTLLKWSESGYVTKEKLTEELTVLLRSIFARV